MDIQQIQNFKLIIDSINKINLPSIDTQWENICSAFNIDTSIHPPKEKIPSVQNIKNYQISSKVKDLIADRPGDLSEVFDLMNTLYYEQIISEVDNTIYISIAARLRDALNQIDNIGGFSSIIVNENWKTAIKLLLITANGKFDYNYISRDTTIRAQSIKNLINLGYKIDWKPNPIEPTLPDKEIVAKIEKLIDDIGRLDIISYCIRNLPYDINIKRYIIIRNSGYQEKHLTHFPYIYLLNIALKHTNRIPPHLPNNDRESILKELVYLVQNYINCYNLDRSTPFVILHTSDLPYFLMKEVLFDTCYIPKQLPVDQVELLINKLFNWIKKDDLDLHCKIKNYIRIFRNFNYRLTQSSLHLPLIVKYKDLKFFGKQNLKDLSISANDINKNYTDPNTFNLNFDNALFSNPIIHLDSNHLLVMSAPIFNYSFFEKIYAIVRSHIDKIKNTGYTSRKVGEAMEHLVYDYITKNLPNNFSLTHNKEYTIPSSLKNKYSLTRTSGECDLILETPDDIWLFEIKAKPLTTKAMMGDVALIIRDLSQSLLTSCEQALVIKMLLLNEKQIFFADGTSINLNNRRIRTVSLSLYDYGSLHTSAFITEFLELIFQGIGLNSKSQDPYYLNLINDINNLHNKIRNLGQGINMYKKNATREVIFSHQFLNISLFLQIMKDYQGNIEKFLEILKNMQCISCGMQDSYVSYLNVKKIVDYKENKN